MDDKFVISLKIGAERDRKGPKELLEAVKALPAGVKIVDGAGRRAITVLLSSDEARSAAHAIDFADIEPYQSLKLL